MKCANNASSTLQGLHKFRNGDGSDSKPQDAYDEAEVSVSLRTNSQQTRKSPFLSIKPLSYSLHPKWKLWSEMNTAQQEEALDEVGKYLQKYGTMVGNAKSKWHGTCEMDTRIGTTGHSLCGPGPPPGSDCVFISFGIRDDASFDREVADGWGCRGFAGDPTVQHPSKLHEKVTFHNFAATTLMDSMNYYGTKKRTDMDDWWYASMPKLRYFLAVDEIELLKMDCEGCEHALSRDILREDPTFLYHIKQLSLEVHVTKMWINSAEHVYYFGLIFALLEEAGFVMEWSSNFGCKKAHEEFGCMPELGKYGWPCGYDPWPAHPRAVLGHSCQEFTFVRYPEKANNAALLGLEQ
jgi:hypothetical protein